MNSLSMPTLTNVNTVISPWPRCQSRACMLTHVSHVWLLGTSWTMGHQAPLSWDSPGKNTRVGCHFLLQCMKVKRESEVAQSCLALSNPTDGSPPGSPRRWDSPGKNTGMGCHSLLQGILPIQGSNLCLLHWQAGSLPVASPGKPQMGAIYLGWSDGRRMSNLRNSSSITKYLHLLHSDNQLSAQEMCMWMKRNLAVHWEEGRQKRRKASGS